MSLKSSVVLVTGSSSGMGRASALAFARVGARVAVSDVDIEGGNETVEMVREAGGEAKFFEADVSKSAEVEALTNHVTQVYGQLDCAHNNAGIEGIQAFTADYPEEDWDQVMEVNLKSVWLCMK